MSAPTVRELSRYGIDALTVVEHLMEHEGFRAHAEGEYRLLGLRCGVSTFVRGRALDLVENARQRNRTEWEAYVRTMSYEAVASYLLTQFFSGRSPW